MTVSTATAHSADDDVRVPSVVKPLTSLIYAGLAAQVLAIVLCAVSLAGINLPGQTMLPFAFLIFVGVGLASMVALTRKVPRLIAQPLAALQTIARTGQAPAGQNAFFVRRDVFGEVARKLTEPAPEPQMVAPEQPVIEETAQAGIDENSRAALDALEQGLAEFAQGNFRHHIEHDFPEEISSLRESYQEAQARISETLHQVSQTVDGLGSGVSEIVSASDDLSKRTERQAVALEETVSTLGTVVDEVRTSTKRLEETSNVAASARQDAESSGAVVDEALTAMREIEDSATKINKIITVIDEIAFQTNLLALNAGVEAARAGDAGQGFAVVASEVRALAQRSATAAREISGLITQSTQQIADGSRLVNQTGSALKRISDHVLNISQNVEAITESAQEQTHALDTLNSSAVEMDGMTQQNAAMAEEVTAASHSLQSHTVELSALLRDVQGAKAKPRHAPAVEAGRAPTSTSNAATLKGAAAALKSGTTSRFADLARTQDAAATATLARRAETSRSSAPQQTPMPRPRASAERATPALTLGNAAIDEDWEEF
ncbi:methyl-accepting chemotaxis protein [Notoacmeibacter ruber]|nr:methyl-accepting chemotaxis protein [Notoacmeibacter ruber]